MTFDEQLIGGITSILTPFTPDVMKRSLIGKQGYFANELLDYRDLGYATFDVLEDISTEGQEGNYDLYPFVSKESGNYSYFIPEEFLKNRYLT